MSYASEAELKEHIVRQCRREGDGKFLAEWPRMLAKAEQRMRYGSGSPIETQRVRVRGMETTATVTFTAGVGPLPDGFLNAKRLSFPGTPPAVPGFVTPDEFEALYVVSSGDSRPVFYTVEGTNIRVKPVFSGTASLLYYGLPSATAGANWLMTNAPGIYEAALLYEAYRFLRNPDQAGIAIQEYAALVDGLIRTDATSRQIGPLRPRVPGARVMR
jgi:hypothetical protein